VRVGIGQVSPKTALGRGGLQPRYSSLQLLQQIHIELHNYTDHIQMHLIADDRERMIINEFNKLEGSAAMADVVFETKRITIGDYVILDVCF
jgi:hypothetical protein